MIGRKDKLPTTLFNLGKDCRRLADDLKGSRYQKFKKPFGRVDSCCLSWNRVWNKSVSVANHFENNSGERKINVVNALNIGRTLSFCRVYPTPRDFYSSRGFDYDSLSLQRFELNFALFSLKAKRSKLVSLVSDFNRNFGQHKSNKTVSGLKRKTQTDVTDLAFFD